MENISFAARPGDCASGRPNPGTLNPEPLPPLHDPNSPQTPAKELFARKTTPLPGPPQSIGSYADGCLAGAIALPITGSSWQVMRVSRNRYWGNPSLMAFIERLADSGKRVGWNGLLIGDMSQPRGGPMLNGHSSHQIGLDVDIWFTPMPDHELSPEEREFNMALNMVAKDRPPSIQKCGHMNARHLSVPLRKIQSSPISSSIRQSRRLCVVRLGRIVLGYPRSALGGDTTSISMSASLVQSSSPQCKPQPPRVPVMDAGAS